ncbi:MAG: GNAT family N-acetyltransferase [Planctomycetota bacterium]|jgi:CelD/BcsL family acetyltransferase involved in cellulose biosynthesis
MMCDKSFHNGPQKNTVNSYTNKDLQKDQRFDLQIAEGAECITEFREHWDDLFARAGDAPPYLSRPWADTFVREGMIRGNPLFILAWRGAKLVALLPLAVRKYLNVKIAEPIGTGEGAYLGLLLDPDYPSVIEHLGDLIATGKLFDVYFSEDLSSEDTATNDLLVRLATKGYSRRKALRSPCYWIRLGCSFDEYIERKITKGKRRKKLRYKERKLFNSADVRIDRYIGKSITAEVNHRVATVQLESWIKRRGGAVLGRPFHQKLLANMSEANLGYVWLMTIDGDDAAMVYALVAHRQLYFYSTAFKLKYESSLSIGQILIMQVIRDACEDGVLSFDFIHGEAEYKRFWATDCHEVHRVAAGRGLSGRLIVFSYYVVWQLVRIKLLKSFYNSVRNILRAYKKRP